MTPNDAGERRSDLKSNLLERLHDPMQLRIGVMASVFLLGYVAICMPLNDQIDAVTKKLARDQNLVDLAINMEQLQKQFRGFSDRVPTQTDTNEWMQYVIEGTRQIPSLKVNNYISRELKQVGPYNAVVLQINMEGSFDDLNRFLVWLESNRRLIRIDTITIVPPKTSEKAGDLAMQLTVLGMTG
jgi:Tfp pilus assembly protein PilO